MSPLPEAREELKAGLPDVSGPLLLKGLDATIEVCRDAYGIPHVKARSVHDAFFGQGFATAQDRLWHMDYDRRRAYGRWAEYAGKAAVPDDTFMRRLQISASVERDYRALNAETRSMLDAYADGVNAFVGATASLPIEYDMVASEPEKWRPWDCLAVFKVRHALMGVFEAKLWRARLVNQFGAERTAAMLPGYQQGHLLIVPPGVEYAGSVGDPLDVLSAGSQAASLLRDIEEGSNSWAVSGSLTLSGKPLLAGDPHRALDTPNVYYQNHISCPDFDAIGLSFPGCPAFPHFGHNAHVAWCVTHAMADYQDLYIERFKDSSFRLYDNKGEWKEAEVRHETIKVRGGRPVDLDVTMTRHGPVIGADVSSRHAIAIKYTAIDGPNRGMQCLLRMLRATSADEIDESMREWVDPCNNFMFADVHGDIGYLNRGQVPLRSMANAWLPVPGWTGEHEWEGFVPFDELPRVRNPETGYIVTANNKIVSDDYPYYLGLDYAPEFRARRITERLKGLKNATVQDMSAIHAERVSVPAQIYVRLLSQVQPLDEHSAVAKEKLSGWDGSMDADAVAPTIYSAFRLQFDTTILRDILGPLADEALEASGRGAPTQVRLLKTLLVTLAEENDTSILPRGADWKSLAARSLADAVAYLRDRLGDDTESWKWARVHATAPQHTLSPLFPETASLLDPPSVPLGGDGDTPQAASYDSSEPFAITAVSVARYVFDTGDWDNSAWVTPLGSSGHPGSPHYADQVPIWAQVQLVPMLYDWRKIEAGAETVQRLEDGG